MERSPVGRATQHNANEVMLIRAEANKIHDKTLFHSSNVNENVELFVDIFNKILHKQMFDGIVVFYWRNNISVKKHRNFIGENLLKTKNMHNCVTLTEEMR